MLGALFLGGLIAAALWLLPFCLFVVLLNAFIPEPREER